MAAAKPSSDSTKVVPLTCHGHSRPVPHLHFSHLIEDDQYYLISACKDNNPMLRDGISGDWIGTFLGHKGAVWQSRLSIDGSLAATASADFTAKVWDTESGETLHTLKHLHIVRAVAFPPTQRPQILATGGYEKKLLIFDLSRASTEEEPAVSNGNVKEGATTAPSFEIGAGTHQGPIKSVVWTPDPNILITACDDKTLRWFDLRSRSTVGSIVLDGTVGSCELDQVAGADPILSVAAGKNVYFFDAERPATLNKKIVLPFEAASVALNKEAGKFVVGSSGDTWVRVYDFDTEKETDVGKGHHGPVWSCSYSPDGKLYATGSEDGTIKLWKATTGPYGLWR